MQAVILAAGKGSRMGDITKNIAKPMVAVEGISLLERNIVNLYSVGVRKAIVAIGHRGDDIRNLLGNFFQEMEIIYVLNEQFDTTNNIYSLWKCKDFLESNDSLIIEGDVLFDPIIVEKIIKSKKENVIGVSSLSCWMNGTIIEENINGYLNLGKVDEKSLNTSQLKTINIYKFSKEFSKEVYFPLVKEKIENKELSLYYEDIITSQILNTFFGIYKVGEGERWLEVDNPIDLWNAGLRFSKTLEQYNAILRSYGGFWRTPELIDFFYLSNPFFPTDELLNDLQRAINRLVTNYPSGREIINSMASVIFECKSDFIIVSNGASEIIECILKILDCNFGILIPTFDEYLNRIEENKLYKKQLLPPHFKITLNDLKALAEFSDCVILVNPNNPTGGIIEKFVLIEFLEFLKLNNKLLIIDESFADFSNAEISLLSQQILDKYDNLFIVKSMGKSYGIPGIRLGLLFSSNAKINELIKRKLPIWNINSVAEFFFELLPRYKKAFRDSCKMVISEREFMQVEISKIETIRSIESHGNFIFCELLNGLCAHKLAYKMYKDFNLLIKDCSEKRGLDKSQYVRIAVKSRAENLLLINAVKQIAIL